MSCIMAIYLNPQSVMNVEWWDEVNCRLVLIGGQLCVLRNDWHWFPTESARRKWLRRVKFGDFLHFMHVRVISTRKSRSKLLCSQPLLDDSLQIKSLLIHKLDERVGEYLVRLRVSVILAHCIRLFNVRLCSNVFLPTLFPYLIRLIFCKD